VIAGTIRPLTAVLNTPAATSSVVSLLQELKSETAGEWLLCGNYSADPSHQPI